MKIKLIDSPIPNGSIVEDKRDGKKHQIMAGFNSEEGWSFLCWEENQKKESDCVTIEFEHLKKLKS